MEDAFESIIGAIYLDLGWDAAKNFVFIQLAPEFKNLSDENTSDELPKIIRKNLSDYKSNLQEFLMKDNPNVKIEYVELNSSGPPHMPTFEYAVKIDDKIFGEGSGNSKKLAEQMAAKKALQKLENQLKKSEEN